MFRYLMLAGLALFLPGLYALGYSVYQGPSAWMVDSQTFWGTPISLFVFWIGLAHAGTLLSAIFLALGIKLKFSCFNIHRVISRVIINSFCY